MTLWVIALVACGSVREPDDTDASGPVTAYEVDWSTDPDPLRAGEQGVFTEQITDQDGNPIEDLQQNHERMVHTMFVSADWTTFLHTHQEDYEAITVDDLRNATFHFPLELPLAGPYLVLFDFAHHNQWLFESDTIVLDGSPGQAKAPDTTPRSTAEVDGLVAELAWATEPRPAFEATWTVHISEQDGTPVDDLVQVLGADAHCALANEDLSWATHTHAWFPGMGDMTPGMEMPHLYTGPDIEFVYTFPAGGAYKMWVQFARSSVPDKIYVAPFTFLVATP